LHKAVITLIGRMLQVHHPIVVNMRGELLFNVAEYSTLGLDVYDYDPTFECKFLAFACFYITVYFDKSFDASVPKLTTD
jgi:hypothetical protein